MKKKILTCMIAFVMTVVMTLGLAGCSEGYLPEYENEYFRYAVRTNKDGTKEGYLIGFTELGAEQTHMILPQEIDGIPIVGFGYVRHLGYGSEWVGEFKNDKLMKLYIPFTAKENTWSSYISIGYLENGAIIQWKSATIWIDNQKVINGFVVYTELAQMGHFQNSVVHFNNYLANISYMYNYEGAEDGGYYWVDSYDNSTVEFIPPEPTREGYRFGGWYKEPECENAWDFTTDKTGDELPIDMSLIPSETFAQYSESDGIRLYAKWIKK